MAKGSPRGQPMRKGKGQTRHAAKRKRAGEAGTGVVRIHCRPTPDAEARLRRFFALLVDYAIEHGTQEPPADPSETQSN